MWELPLSVIIDEKEYKITNNCDYRMVLDVICALNDNELTNSDKIKVALYIFYEDLSDCTNLEKAVEEMYKIISGGKMPKKNDQNKPKIMDWKHDFPQIAPPVSRVLGYDVRTADKSTHWYTFLGAYQEIGECTFQNIISIRTKKRKGKKLEDWEREFYKENRELVDLPNELSADEIEWLEGED